MQHEQYPIFELWPEKLDKFATNRLLKSIKKFFVMRD